MASEVVEIAEHKSYLELTSRICYYNDINANKMMLPYDETTEVRAKTLVNMPVQARYTTNSKGEPTFKGHEMYKLPSGDVIFNTNSIGTHTEVFVKDDTITTFKGELKTLPCLFAKYRIWKRYENVVAAAKRLFDLKRLFSSWEITTSSYEFKDGIKKIIDYEFIANTLLGFEFATPSYGSSANALAMATDGNQMLIAEALSQDLIIEGGINYSMQDNTKKKDNIDEKNTVLAEKANNDICQNNDLDLQDNIEKACQENTLSDPEEGKTPASVKDRDSVIKDLKTKIAMKDDALIKASESIALLKSEIAVLKSYKEKFEIAEQKRIDGELVEKKASIIASVEKSGLITKEEIMATEELKGYVDTLDEKSLKAIVAERYIASLCNTPDLQGNETETATTNLNNVEDIVENKDSIVKRYLGGK